MDVILNSKRQNLGLIKHSLLKSDALIKLGFFRFKTCPKKWRSKNFLPFLFSHYVPGSNLNEKGEKIQNKISFGLDRY